MGLSSIFQGITKRNQYLPSSGYQPFIIQGNSIVPNTLIDASTSLKNSDVFSVVNLIASDVASFMLHPINAGQYTNLLTLSTSPMTNSYQFWTTVVTQLLVTGNSYVLIHDDWLEIIPVSEVTIEMGDNSDVIQYDINFDDDRGEVIAEASEVLHFRLLSNPESGFDGCQYVGISPLDSLVSELQTKAQAQKLTLSQLKRAIMPSNLITIPEAKVDSATKDNIRSKFEEQNLSGTSSTIVMDQSATLSQIQIDKNVADFLSTLDWSTERVASAFGIPTSYILSSQGDAQSSVSDISHQYLQSLTKYYLPLVSEIQSKLNLPNFNVDIRNSVDVDGSQLISMVQTLTNSSNPVITSAQAQQLLKQNNVLPSSFIVQDVPANNNNNGGDTHENSN